MSEIHFGTDGWRDIIADGYTMANLAQATQGNDALRQRVESLLGSYQAGDFLEDDPPFLLDFLFAKGGVENQIGEE